MFQWARIVLVVERGVDPKSRLENQVLYSQPMVDGRRAFMRRQIQSVKTSRPEVMRISVTEITPHVYFISSP